jgi:hypothetical protein
MNDRTLLPLLLAAPLAAACFQEINTAAGDGTRDSTFVSDGGASLDSGSAGDDADCNSNGTCMSCPSGFFLQYAAGGGTWCLPFTVMTPPINNGTDLADAANVFTNPCQQNYVDSMNIRHRYCANCHSGGPNQVPNGTFSSVLDDKRLVTEVSKGVIDDAGKPVPLVVPGDPDHSRLYNRILRGEMPPPGNLRPSISDLSVLRAWINCLGPNQTPLGDQPGGGPSGGSAPSGDDGGGSSSGG